MANDLRARTEQVVAAIRNNLAYTTTLSEYEDVYVVVETALLAVQTEAKAEAKVQQREECVELVETEMQRPRSERDDDSIVTCHRIIAAIRRGGKEEG